jgi:hypothetical protein
VVETQIPNNGCATFFSTNPTLRNGNFLYLTGNCNVPIQSGTSCDLLCSNLYPQSGSLRVTCNAGVYTGPSGSCGTVSTVAVVRFAVGAIVGVSIAAIVLVGGGIAGCAFVIRRKGALSMM